MYFRILCLTGRRLIHVYDLTGVVRILSDFIQEGLYIHSAFRRVLRSSEYVGLDPGLFHVENLTRPVSSIRTG